MVRLETIEVQNQTIIVHLHAISASALCPRCGTPGSRVHSHYQRTIADVAFGGRCLVLKLRVRKWICREVSCSQHIFAERFPELVQRYARMMDRLVNALQTLGVTTNGTDAARIASSLGMPTTAKTIIRRVLQLPLPSEGEVVKVGIDEWAWKKGQRYGTILVDLEKRRVVQLLAERSVETSTAWLRTHPEIDLVSRDRGKIFRAAATDGAPQANQVVDRFHLQKNFAEALEKFFRKQERALKKAIQGIIGKTRPAARTAVPEKVAQERQARHRQQVQLHKRIWKLYRQGCHKEQIAQLVGVSSRKVYRVLEQETPPPPRRRSRSSSIVDPYLSYLTARWNQGCHNVAKLYEEIVTRGYTGTQRTLQMRLRPFRQNVARPVSKQTVIWNKPPSSRGVALMMIRPAQNRTREQAAYLDQLIQCDVSIALVFKLAQDFGRLLRRHEGRIHLEQWKAAVQASGIAELITFVDGLADDEEAVAKGCSLTWSNGMVEGFVNKVKWIKRSSYGQAGFPLLQRRVLLHPTAHASLGKDERERSPRGQRIERRKLYFKESA
ncbi:transposase [Dictyobacter alpinus]|uniref:Transposase n=1 Tax=Dictyobacter alpinus TaxID=2014873 RepID=A0A402B9Z3_9CHLR|nr:ISL3 family transposase [Dictyobacter alpinus]GCE28122.1 transposase [Dictyobacter alpinus]